MTARPLLMLAVALAVNGCECTGPALPGTEEIVVAVTEPVDARIVRRVAPIVGAVQTPGSPLVVPVVGTTRLYQYQTGDPPRSRFILSDVDALSDEGIELEVDATGERFILALESERRWRLFYATGLYALRDPRAYEGRPAWSNVPPLAERSPALYAGSSNPSVALSAIAGRLHPLNGVRHDRSQSALAAAAMAGAVDLPYDDAVESPAVTWSIDYATLDEEGQSVVRAALRGEVTGPEPSAVALERAVAVLSAEDWRQPEPAVRAILARGDISSRPAALALFAARDEAYAMALGCERLEVGAGLSRDLLDVMAILAARADDCPAFDAWLDENRCGLPRGSVCLCHGGCSFDDPAAQVSTIEAELRNALTTGDRAPDPAYLAYWLAASRGSSRPALVWRRLCYGAPEGAEGLFDAACEAAPSVSSIEVGEQRFRIDDERRLFERVE